MRRDVEAQLRLEMENMLEEANQSSSCWSNLFSCCLPKKSVKIKTATELAAKEDEHGLLRAAAEGNWQ